MNDLDKKTIDDLIKYYPIFSNNGKAGITGYIGESKLCNLMGWEQIDADGYDATTTESINIQIGNQVIQKTNRKIKIEIKTMTDNTDTNVLPYDSQMKTGKYDYLAVYLYSKNRLSLIPHDTVEEIVNTPGCGLTINLNPGIRHNHSKPIYSEFTKLFFDYEIKEFNKIIKN